MIVDFINFANDISFEHLVQSILYEDQYEIIITIYFKWFIWTSGSYFSAVYSLPLILGKLIHHHLKIILLGYKQVPNYWLNIIYKGWRVISNIFSQYSFTTHLNALYWSNWDVPNTSKNVYIWEIRFINQNSNKLGESLCI